MKINKLHLRDFGNMKDRELVFSDGLNVLYGTNEAGKSTVWTALLALLFGMEKKEEEKFRPWNSEYGASEVTYTFRDGRQFTASKKRRKGFQTQMTETASGRDVSDDYPQQRGVVLAVTEETGVSREAFLASVMMGQDALGVEEKKSAGLRTRLSRLSAYGDESTDVSAAKKLLERELEAIGRGATGSKKKLVAIKRELEELEAAHEEAKGAEARRTSLYQELDALEEQLFKGKRLWALYKKFMDKAAFEDAQKAESMREEAEALEQKLAFKKKELSETADNSEVLLRYRKKAEEIEQAMRLLSRDEEETLRQREIAIEAEKGFRETEKEAAKKETERKTKERTAFVLMCCLSAAGLLCALPAVLLSPIFWGLTALLWAAAVISYLALRPKKAGGKNEKEVQEKSAPFRYEQSRLKAMEGLIVSKRQEISEQKEELQKALGAQGFEEAKAAVQKMEETEEYRKKLLAEIELLVAQKKGFEDARVHEGEAVFSGEAPNWSEEEEKAIEGLGITRENALYKREQLEAQIREMAARQAALQKELELLDAGGAHPGDLEDAISALREEEHALLLKRAAIETALLTLEEAQQRIQQDYIPRLNARMEEWFTKMTSERYSGTFTTMEMTPEAEDARYGRVLPMQLSRGTWDQLYLAYRLAAADLLSGEEPLPLVMDEPFAYFDDIRLRRMLEALSELSKERQIILMTCQKREMEMLSEMGAEAREIVL